MMMGFLPSFRLEGRTNNRPADARQLTANFRGRASREPLITATQNHIRRARVEIHPLRDVSHFAGGGAGHEKPRLAGCTGFVTMKPYFEQDHFREVTQMVKSHFVTSR